MVDSWSSHAEALAWATSSGRLENFQPLLQAEQEIVSSLQSGTFSRVGDGSRPLEGDQSRIVRAEFLRFLILGGEDGLRPHEKGIRVQGAWITGNLDLEACRIYRDVGLSDCHFESKATLRAAIINRLFLDGSLFPGLDAERLEARAGIYLRGAEVLGEANFYQARLGGNLECDGATLRNVGGFALRAGSLEVRNLLMRGTTVHGRINLVGAVLQADLDLGGATIVGGDSESAVDATESELQGSVILRQTHIHGQVRMVGMSIAGDVDLSGIVVDSPDKRTVDLSRAKVRGAFFLRRGARIDGVLALTDVSIGTIHDDSDCWPRPGDLLLNRCRYDAFIDGPVDAASRLDWLARQVPGRWDQDFWPQPYEQLAAVFRSMGHDRDARHVLLEKERLQRQVRRNRIGNPVRRALAFVSDGIVGVTLGYGLRPFLAFNWLVLFWAIGVAVFGYAERQGAVMPNSPVVLRAPEWTLCGAGMEEEKDLFLTGRASGLATPGQTQLDCFRNRWEASSYPRFNAWMYSVDTLLPVLEMGQRTYWRPNPNKPGGQLALNYFYFQSTVGWALSLLAVAGFSGLVKSR